jgi:hypothetical protein
MSLRQFTPPRYLPLFSSRPGVKISLPGSAHVVQAFPTALRLFLCRPDGLELVRELVFPKLGVPHDWRVLLDAMRRTICIEGKGSSGFFRLRIEQTFEGLSLRSMKGPFEVRMHDQVVPLQKNESLILAQPPYLPVPFPMPRLLLGCNKARQWDRISASPEMSEVLPLWYEFGSGGGVADEPSSTLFGAVVKAIHAKDTPAVFPAYEVLFRAGVEGMFAPKKTDDCFLGYDMPIWPDGMELTAVHDHVCATIRSLFFTEEGAVVTLLPCLPRECVAGRLLHERLSTGHTINIEWRKGVLRRVLLRAAHDGVLTFKAALRTGSIRSLRTPGRKKQVLFGEPIEVRQGENYLLDNFSA